MSIENKLSQCLTFKKFSDNYYMLNSLIELRDYRTIFLSLLFLRLISLNDKGERLVLKKESADLVKTNDEFSIEVPREADFDWLLNQSFNCDNNKDRISDAIDSLNKENSYLEKRKIFNELNYVLLNLSNSKETDYLFRSVFDFVNHINEELLNNGVDFNSGNIFDLYVGYFSILEGRNLEVRHFQDSLSELIVKIIDPKPFQTVYDPSCGTGSLLLKFKDSIITHYTNDNNCYLYGQERNLTILSIAEMNMIVNRIFSYKLESGNSITNPKFLDENKKLMQFDIVVSCPPFSLKMSDMDYEELCKDEFDRFQFGVPPQLRSDFSYILHMIKSMKDNGRMAIVVPNGVLFRGGTEGEIRKKLIENKLLEAVIGLPEKLIFGTSIPVSLLVFSKCKSKSGVKFIDASKEYVSTKNLNYLGGNNINKVINLYNNESEDDCFYFATLDEVRHNDYNLNISRYIFELEKGDNVDLGKIANECENLKVELGQLEIEMKKLIDNII